MSFIGVDVFVGKLSTPTTVVRFRHEPAGKKTPFYFALPACIQWAVSLNLQVMKQLKDSAKTSKAGWLILGDQLFSTHYFASAKGLPALMVEDEGLCTHFKYHKKKIAFFLSAMRHFQQTHKDHFDWTYVRLEKKNQPDYWKELLNYCKDQSLTELHIFEVSDKFMEKGLIAFADRHSLDLVFHPSPSFLTSRAQFKDYLQQVKKPFMKTFYERQRKRMNILMEPNGKPLGGQYSFDEENRKPFKGQKAVPAWPPATPDKITLEVLAIVQKLFPDHPGTVDDFQWPVDHLQAQFWLSRFLKDCLQDFGEFEDAIVSDQASLFHSLLSPLMNSGLLTPEHVVRETLKAWKKQKSPLNSVEGFLRQVIGWREFIFGIYQNFSEKQDTANFFKHQRKMASTWYSGTTGVPILDDTIQKVQKNGYGHHIERLMILSNLMLLSEIDPRQVHRWFMEMFVDSSDWVMGPNVYGMGQFSDGGLFATKPYVCGSSYLLKMSDYKKGPWCDEIDGLYWRFIKNKKDFFSSNPRMKMMVSAADKISPDRWKLINEAAQKFLDRNCS